MSQCTICHKIVKKFGMGSHLSKFHKNGNHVQKTKNETSTCSICGKTTKKFGMGPHHRLFHTKVSHPTTGVSHRAWNKGLTVNTHPSVKQGVDTWNKNIDNVGYVGGKYTEYKCLNGKTIKLQSSYEVTVAEILDQNQIDWIRPKPLNYFSTSTGRSRKYFPDFYLPKYNIYLDPKNEYLIPKDCSKIVDVIRDNNVKVLVLDYLHLNLHSILDSIELLSYL